MADSPQRSAAICDASVLAAMIFGEPRADEACLLTRGRRLLAPSLIRYELAHVAVRKTEAAGADAGQVARAFAAGLGVPIRMVEPSWPAVVALAREEKLSTYDAAYLQLALALQVPLVTLDGRLGAAAHSLGVWATRTAL